MWGYEMLHNSLKIDPLTIPDLQLPRRALCYHIYHHIGQDKLPRRTSTLYTSTNSDLSQPPPLNRSGKS
jgi:hypothetical protein